MLYVTRGAEKVGQVSELPCKRSLDKGVAARQARGGRPRRRAGPGHAARRGWTTWPTCDLVVEAVVEELSVKQALFATLDEICKPGAVLATTTSSLPVIELRDGHRSARPTWSGLHFFNPAPVMTLVEVVRTIRPRRRRRQPPSRAVCEHAGQARRRVRRPRRLHRQRAAVPLPQRRRQDAGGALRDRRRHRLRDEAGLRLPDRTVRAARRRRARRVATPSSASSTWSSASPGSRRRRCSSSWSPPAISAARPAGASATTAESHRRDGDRDRPRLWPGRHSRASHTTAADGRGTGRRTVGCSSGPRTSGPVCGPGCRRARARPAPAEQARSRCSRCG